MIVEKTSVFPAAKQEVFGRLQKLETLQYISKPYATFESAEEDISVWTVGSTSSYRLKLFGFISCGTHTIHIARFDPEGISSREGNEHVQVWNHDIMLVPMDESHTEYTDRVEIKAGWKTLFVWLWANAFYRHRQRKWIRLLKDERIV